MASVRRMLLGLLMFRYLVWILTSIDGLSQLLLDFFLPTTRIAELTSGWGRPLTPITNRENKAETPKIFMVGQ
jgi:hypothetical protein